MESGLSFESFAGVVGVSTAAIEKWAHRHSEFKEAKYVAFSRCQLFWEKLGVLGTTGKVKDFNCATWIFNMKNRFKWTDRQQINANVNKTIEDILKDKE